jgi:hypothetical protein
MLQENKKKYKWFYKMTLERIMKEQQQSTVAIILSNSFKRDYT